MFDQFIGDISGKQAYLIFSLWVFLLFFVLVSILLYRMKKQHTTYMSDIPLDDCSISPSNPSEL